MHNDAKLLCYQSKLITVLLFPLTLPLSLLKLPITSEHPYKTEKMEASLSSCSLPFINEETLVLRKNIVQ